MNRYEPLRDNDQVYDEDRIETQTSRILRKVGQAASVAAVAGIAVLGINKGIDSVTNNDSKSPYDVTKLVESITGEKK